MKIRRLISSLMISIVMLLSALSVQAADQYQRSIEDFQASPQTTPFFKDAYGYAVFPKIGKGGFFVGGAYGEGQVYQGGAISGQSSMGQVTFGAQMGGQVYSQIIFFEDKRAYQQFTSGSFELGAQASAVALTIGASAQAGTNGTGAAAGSKQFKAHYVNGMAIFTLATGGLMYEASVGGQGFSFTAK